MRQAAGSSLDRCGDADAREDSAALGGPRAGLAPEYRYFRRRRIFEKVGAAGRFDAAEPNFEVASRPAGGARPGLAASRCGD